MLKVYTGEVLSDLPVTELIRPNLKKEAMNRWTERYVKLRESVVEIVSEPGEADFLLLPHNWNLLKNRRAFVEEFVKCSAEFGKKILIFFPGDSAESVEVPNSIIFRNSVYKSRQKANEIIIPGYVEDLGASGTWQVRSKGEKAVVGFCGWADVRSMKERIKFWLRSVPLSMKSAFHEEALYEQRGLWWRKRLLRELANSDLLKTNFIIRRSYSGNEKTIELDPIQARREYIDNIKGSDFTLAVKGDGNFSTRFYETLSLGRLPLFVDTDCVLPLQEMIAYNEFVLRIDGRKVKGIGRTVADYFAQMDESEYAKRQNKAREVFEKYLRLDSFFQFIFRSGYLLKYK